MTVTLPVVFVALFSGIAGANATVGATAALLAYVLPVASPGGITTIPDRLIGWWLASLAGTAAVLALSPPLPGDRLRIAAARLADAIAAELADASAGSSTSGATAPSPDTAGASAGLRSATLTSPYRPTGLSVRDQAIANLVEMLQWCVGLVGPLRQGAGLAPAGELDRPLLSWAERTLRATAAMLRGERTRPHPEQLALLLEQREARLQPVATQASPGEVHVTYHAWAVAGAARAVAADALIAVRRGDPKAIEDERRHWQGDPAPADPSTQRRRWQPGELLVSNATVRSMWFLNSARGAVAIAASVGIAALSDVQHGFWVVLGTLSVLRTNVASTGATAARAIGGTAAGFFVGAGLIVAIGTSTAALWVVLPLAVGATAYALGTTPFAAGQAAFTVTLSVLYNLIVPIGWKIGELRLEDVALGAGVSVAAGLLFWPRGAGRVVTDDLGEAFQRAGLYLVQAARWALALRASPPDAGHEAVRAAGRLDEALRALLAEQGTKHVPRDELWQLVGGARRIRLAAQSLASSPRASADTTGAAQRLLGGAVQLAGRCDEIAETIGRAAPSVAAELATLPALATDPGDTDRCRLWVGQHLDHVRRDLDALGQATALVAGAVRRPWWR